MAYLTINGTDFSHLVSELRVNKAHNYNAQTNAAGDTVVDYINAKRTIEVGFIHMPAETVKGLLAALDAFSVSVGYRDPVTNAMVSGVSCIVPDISLDYYTIQSGRVMTKGFTVKLNEL